MDYSSLKVTELKEELKKRGIPTTKLTRKQDIIDRLVEEDEKNNANGADADGEDAQEEAPAAVEEPSQAQAGEPVEAVTAVEEPKGLEANDASVSEPAQEPTPSEPLVTKQPVEQAAPEPVPSEPAVPVSSEPTPDVTSAKASIPSTPTQQASEEVLEDSKKRKRRSPTPPIREESISKKLKQAEDVVHVEKEEAMADAPIPVNGDEAKDVPMEGAEESKADAKVLPMGSSDDVMDVSSEAKTADAAREAVSPSKTRSPRTERRFRDLKTPSASLDQEAPTEPQEAMEESVEVSPALHPATRALYIRELIRPMQPNAFRDHLQHLATPPSGASEDLIESFHLDALRTHAFAVFTSVSSASRVRASLHNRVWPAEPTRRPLWADFIPEEKVAEWIETELANGGSRPSQAKRWEVAYDVNDDGVHVDLVEAGSNGHRSMSMAGAPTGPRDRGSMSGGRRASFGRDAPVRAPSQPLVSGAPVRNREEVSAAFLDLDKLFQSTTHKPKLYFQPVEKDLADRRLDELDRQTARDWDPREDARINPGDSNGRGLDQLRRFTFEDGDVLVDGGPEYGGGRAFGRVGPGESYRGRGYGGRRGGDRYR
ncbi:hypothetical protein M8818_005776 [Zalaria obscura]|uniref:Uncharacterized protein n=1 Tax=Zalaria obscura TaxID=2024903 RepID=A0ACC3S9C5_9PEZI